MTHQDPKVVEKGLDYPPSVSSSEAGLSSLDQDEVSEPRVFLL